LLTVSAPPVMITQHYAPHPGFGPWVGTWRRKYSQTLSTA